MTTDTDDVFFDKAAEFIWLASWPLAGLWFLGIVGYQVLHWLRIGSWKEIPFVAVFNYFDIELSAVYDPQSWIGIARIVQWLLSLPLSFLGALLILFFASTVRGMIIDN